MRALLTFAMMVICLCSLEAQERKPSFNAPYSIPKEFLKTQWWLGFKFGGNLSSANPVERFNGFSPMNYESKELNKSYENEWGGHAGIDITFYFKGFSVGIQPNFRHMSYGYHNGFTWGDDGQSFDTEHAVIQKLNYLDFPLYAKYDITRSVLRPYVMAGLYYSVLMSAEKSVRISVVDTRTDPPLRPSPEELNAVNKIAMDKTTSGYLVGVGASWDPWNVRIVAEVAYRDTFGSITSSKIRFSENQLASIGNVDDDISLRNISASLSFLFPLRFISKDFSAL